MDVADGAGVSQAWLSRMERGLGQAASLETWASVAAAVSQQLVAFLEDAPGADRPRDYEHLKRQQLVIETATQGGWRAIPELAIDPAWTHSRSVDVLLERPSSRESIVVEAWDFFDDVGAAVRGLDGKIATLVRMHQQREAAGGAAADAGAAGAAGAAADAGAATAVADAWAVGGLFVVRGTRRNRALVQEFRTLFASRFPASSGDWLAALRDPTRRLPPGNALLWTDVPGTRLIPARLRR